MATSHDRPAGASVRARGASSRSGRVLLGVVACFALVLAACGDDGDSGAEAPAKTSTTSGAETSLDKMSVDELCAQGKDEGKVTVYGPISPDAMAGVAKAFASDHPGIDLEAVTLNVDEIVSRITTEQRGGQFAADVVVNDGFRLQQLASVEAVVPYEPSEKPELLDGLETPDGFPSVAFVTTRAVAYNPSVLEQRGLKVPTSLEDLTAPEWKENFATTPHGVDIYTGMIEAYGQDEATRLLDALGANQPRLVESNSQSITQVQTGDIAAAISYGTYASPAKQKDPTTVDFFNTDPLLTTTYFQALAAKAPNQAAARCFINWFGSADGQQSMVDESGFSSIRGDVENDPEVWDPEKWEPAFVPVLDLDEYNAQLEQYRAAMKVP